MTIDFNYLLKNRDKAEKMFGRQRQGAGHDPITERSRFMLNVGDKLICKTEGQPETEFCTL